MLTKLRELNPRLPLYNVTDPAFNAYGRVIEGLDTEAIIKEAKTLSYPEKDSLYIASLEAFEALPIKEKIQNLVFGTLDTQLGYCYGYSDTLNATEWHYSSELNIAVTPLVLILGLRSDLTDSQMDSSSMKAFYLPAGTVVEVYATTTHFCPCQVQKEGFGCVVGLPRGTNTPLDAPTEDKLLFRKNKWIIAHNDNATLLARGVVGGITGENFKIRY